MARVFEVYQRVSCTLRPKGVGFKVEGSEFVPCRFRAI